jgi:outer membrane protease
LSSCKDYSPIVKFLGRIVKEVEEGRLGKLQLHSGNVHRPLAIVLPMGYSFTMQRKASLTAAMILSLFVMSRGISFASEDTGLRFLVISGMEAGKLGEYVYSGTHTLSYLEWEILPAGSIGIDLQYNASRGWFAGIGFTGYIPWKTGTMEDRDWETGDPNDATKFSSHDAFLVGGYRADVRAGFRLRSEGPVKMSLFLGYLQSWYFMEGRDGYREYPPGTERVYVEGTVIDYSQLYLVPHAGLMMEGPLGRRSSLIFTARFTPFTICYAVDNHYRRDPPLQFHDLMQHGIFAELSLGWFFEHAPKRAFFLGAGLRVVPEFRGDYYYIETDTGDTYGIYKNGAGASLFLLGVQAGYRITVGH